MWIPTKNHDLVKFANKDQIKDYIDVQNLPLIQKAVNQLLKWSMSWAFLKLKKTGVNYH
jgi:hypothetical protein